MRGVFLDLDSVHPGDLDLMPLQGTLDEWRFFEHTSRDETTQRLSGAQVVVTNKVHIDRDALEANPQIELVCVAATGTNNVDLEAAARAGVVVSNARDYATASVVDHVFALLLTLSRRLDGHRRRVSDGDWFRSRHFCVFDQPIEELAGKQLGIVGYGVLGRAVAAVARAFSMSVLVAQRLQGEPLADRPSLGEVLERCDVISLHCPLTEQTRGLIGVRELQHMKPTALLINTARGGIVDEWALAEALRQGWIAGAGLDVLSEEPPPEDHCLLAADIPNLIVTPHIAWASRAARQRLLAEVAANIEAFRNGKPRNRMS